MGVGVTGSDPLTAMRAVLQIMDAKVVDSRFRDRREQAQKQFETTLKVLSGAGERDGETFSEWFSFPADGCIGAKTKTGQLLTATLGTEARAETLDELADKLAGKTFSARIVASSNGQYPRVQHDTIGPASQEGEAEADNGPAHDVDNDFGESLC